MELTLVIPVWNDLPGLSRLLQQAADFGIFAEVIIADDASDIPLGPETVASAAALADRITWMHSDRRRGAGHARNMALKRVRSSHVIFFDSDDLFTEEFRRIAALAAAETQPFDFLIFRHDDSRMLDAGGQGTFPNEERRWRAVAASEMLAPLTPAQATVLCQISAYPWNKIYRTDFLRENNIRCTETMVHNDVELHWNSFVTAQRILTCALPGATHFVQDGGSRLTNRRSAERLEVFRAMANVMSRITAGPAPAGLGFLQPFTRFSCDLVNWIGGNIEAEDQPELLARAQRHFLANLDRRLMTLIAYADPETARKINRLILQGELP